MAGSRATRRRLALVSDHERRLVDGHEGVAARRVDGNDVAAGLLARADVPLPPSVPTTKPTPTPQPTVNIPSSTVSIIPVTCAIVGTFVVCAAAFFFWYRKQRRKKEVNKRNTWYDPAKFNNKATLSIEPAPTSSSSTDKPAATAYPPRKVSATPRATPRSGAAAPSPLRNQANDDSKNKPSASKPTTSATPSASAGPLSPVSPGPTPSEKTAFNPSAASPISTPPVAATNRFSFLKDASKLPPSFQGQEAPRVQPMKRSASLLSSRMSTRRKPQRQDTAPAAPSEADAPIIPSLRITDVDSPLEDAKAPAHPLEGKLVTVVDQYNATMPDELGVTPGETLRVIEAYDDGWCLAERVGRKKGRGILPQIVVAEKGSLRANTRFSTLMREGQ